jgi:hypothetical protein
LRDDDDQLMLVERLLGETKFGTDEGSWRCSIAVPQMPVLPLSLVPSREGFPG